MKYGKFLPSEFFLQDTETVAKELIGKLIINHSSGLCLGGRIIETEAYLHENDEASHSYCGKTKRNAAMFEQGGILYVYRSYGIHLCMNIVTEQSGIGSAVLLRAVQPIYGIEQMMILRNMNDIKRISNGPGNLTKALGIRLEDNFSKLSSESVAIYDDNCEIKIKTTGRIGISKAKDLQLRFLAITTI